MMPVQMRETSLFASATVAMHLLRGALGILAIAAAIYIAPESTAASLALGVAALLAFRGCPMCWTIGLIETISARWRRKDAPREPG